MQKNSFFQELKRRNVYKVALTYVIVSWLILQVASIVLPIINAPEWVMQFLLFFLVIGFPIAIILAWAFEMSPQGIIRTTSIESEKNPLPDYKKKPLTSNLGIGFLLFLVVGQYAYFNFYKTNPDTAIKEVPKDVIQQRVAVLPLKNLTNDPSLDNFGEIASNWINQGLMDLDDAVVVSPFTVHSNREAIGILPNDPSGRASFSQLTGAQNIITGTYYLNKDTLICTLEVQDALTGQLRFAIPNIIGDQDNKENLISLLRNRVIGYWATKEMVDAKKIMAPRYDAYELYLEMMKTQNWSLFFQIVDLDSTFYLPRIHFLNLNRSALLSNMNAGQFEFLDRHFDNLSKYEIAWLKYLKYYYSGNMIAAFEALNALRIDYPEDFHLNHETVVLAREGLNNPALAAEINQELERKQYNRHNTGIYFTYNRYHNLMLRYRIDGLAGIEEYVSEARSRTNEEKDWAQSLLFLWTGYMAKDKTLVKIYAAELAMVPNIIIASYFMGQLYNSTLASDEMNTVLISALQSRLEKEETLNPDHRCFYEFVTTNRIPTACLQKHLEPYDLLNRLSAEQNFWYALYEATYYLEQNNMDSVNVKMETIKTFSEPSFDIAAPWGAGMASYRLGILYTKMGDHASAIQYLKRARNLGKDLYPHSFKFDTNLSPLNGNPEFEKLHDPIWPELLN